MPAWQPCLPEVVELYVYFRGDLPAIGLLAEPATLVEVTESSEAARLATGRFKTAKLPDLVALSNVVAIQIPATRGGEVTLNDSALEIGTKTMRETP